MFWQICIQSFANHRASDARVDQRCKYVENMCALKLLKGTNRKVQLVLIYEFMIKTINRMSQQMTVQSMHDCSVYIQKNNINQLAIYHSRCSHTYAPVVWIEHNSLYISHLDQCHDLLWGQSKYFFVGSETGNINCVQLKAEKPGIQVKRHTRRVGRRPVF